MLPPLLVETLRDFEVLFWIRLQKKKIPDDKKEIIKIHLLSCSHSVIFFLERHENCDYTKQKFSC